MLRKMLFLILCLSMFTMSLGSAAAQDETFALTLLHTNDTHAAHQPNNNGDGGVARQMAVVNQIRAEGGNVLLLDSGDRFTGTLFHRVFLGQDNVEIMNLLGYDAMTLGNHEFDNGSEVLLAFLQGVDFPVVSANIDFGGNRALGNEVLPYVVLEVGGEQVGVVGLTTPDTVDTSSPDASITFETDLAEKVEGAVAALTEEGVNKVVLLTHLGILVDEPLLTSLNGVDVVLGGHSHSLLSNTYSAASGAYPIESETEAGEPIVYAQAGSNNLYLGHLDVEFDAAGLITDAGGDTILLSRYITPDPQMEALVAELAIPIEALRSTPIEGAVASVELVGDRAVCRVEECDLGNLITDSMLVETGAQIAIMNGGGIRANIDEGEITVGDVLTVLPFGNLVSTFELSGADVIAALENGVSRIMVDGGVVVRDGASGRFPQVGGMRFSFDPTQPEGSRIVGAEVLNADGSFSAIDPAATYSVASNDFLRRGGDGYNVFADNAINAYDFGRPLDEVFSDYLATLGDVGSMIDGRITLVNATLAPQ
jgi:5'-nucleotidase / UDP-sugar diphosphatase